MDRNHDETQPRPVAQEQVRHRPQVARELDRFSIAEREPVRDAMLPRLFVREPNWKVVLKQGSERMFCFLMQPGETTYHRIGDGEIYLKRGDEQVCIPCADRQGLLHYEPKVLRTSVQDLALKAEPGDEYHLHDEGKTLGD